MAVDMGMITSWSSDYSVGSSFMEDKDASILLEVNSNELDVLLYFPELPEEIWREGEIGLAVGEEQVLLLHREPMIIQPGMVVDYREIPEECR